MYLCTTREFERRFGHLTQGKLWNLDLAMIMFIWPRGDIHYFKNAFTRSLGRLVVNPLEFWLAVEEIRKIKKYVGKFSRVPQYK